MVEKQKHEKTFYLKNGKTFTTIKQLAKHLKEMSGDVYSHHVNPTKNDFANWTKKSLKKEKLAKKIEGHISKIEMELHILRDIINNPEKKTSTIKKVDKTKAKKGPTKKKTETKKTNQKNKQ